MQRPRVEKQGEVHTLNGIQRHQEFGVMYNPSGSVQNLDFSDRDEVFLSWVWILYPFRTRYHTNVVRGPLRLYVGPTIRRKIDLASSLLFPVL